MASVSLLRVEGCHQSSYKFLQYENVGIYGNYRILWLHMLGKSSPFSL